MKDDNDEGQGRKKQKNIREKKKRDYVNISF